MYFRGKHYYTVGKIVKDLNEKGYTFDEIFWSIKEEIDGITDNNLMSIIKYNLEN